MPQSWSPAGSSKICRTSQRVRLARRSAAAPGPRASAPVPSSSCSSKYGSSASAQRVGVPAGLAVQLAERRRSGAARPARPGGTARCGPAPGTPAALAVTAGGVVVDRRRPRPTAAPGWRSCSHSSSRLESTWRTSSPSHSMRSSSSSVCASLGHGLPQRLVRVGEVAQHQPLGAGQPVEADVLGERHRPLVHVADHRLRRQLVVGDPRVPAPVGLVGARRAARPAACG